AATIATDTAVRRIVRPGRGRGPAVAGCCMVPRPGPVPGAASRPGDGTVTDGGPATAVIGSGRCWRAAATAGWPGPLPARSGVPQAGGRALVRPGRGG